jgi:MYXO-CTERM domain-containing protein
MVVPVQESQSMMRTLRQLAFCVAILGLAATARAGPAVGYTFDLTTNYNFGTPSPNLGGGAGSPDTGYFTITNNGASTFVGTSGDVAISNFGGNESFSVPGFTLAPGQSATIVVGNESSNVGGFNGPFGSPQPGVQMFLTGTVSVGSNMESVNLSVNDADVHSGVPRTNPFGVLVDSYVLQGGDPIGRDTGDGFETTQASGHFRFFEAAPTPEPSTFVLAGLGGLGLLAARRRRRALA